MKKMLSFLLLSIIMVSCYESYLKDFDYNAVYFTYQTDVRTFVVGEGMKIQIGVALGGVKENTLDRNVGFTVQNSLITPAILTTMKNGASYIKTAVSSVSTLLPLPSNYYTLSDNSTIVIKSGQHSGSVTLNVDSAKFLSDPATLVATYAIPVYITSANVDSILEPKRYTVIGLKYENMLFGNYWHGGVTTVKDGSGTTINTIRYPTTIPTAENKMWKLTTIAPNKLVTNGYSDQITTKTEMTLTLNGTSITISNATGSTFNIQPDGTSTFNNAKLLQDRKLVLSYKYVNGANTYYVQDTLTFRNRIRDGVSEWQDENPSHYSK
jgi:hypothetical protein